MSDAAPAHHRRIVVLIPTDTDYGRQLMSGVADYADRFGHWSLKVLGPARTSPGRAAVAAWQPHGAIVFGSWGRMLAEANRLGVPTINVSGEGDGDGEGGAHWPRVAADDHAIGRLAAEDLLARGFHHFAHVVGRRTAVGDQRAEGFAKRLAEAGHHHVTVLRWANPKWNLNLRPDQRRQAREWLEGLPLPCGVFGASDRDGAALLQVAADLPLAVPGDLAVIGVGNDPVMCLSATPPLASVTLDGRRVGRRAAIALDDLLDHPDAPPADMRLPPVGIRQRASSDTLAVNEPALRTTLAMLSAASSAPLQVDDLVRHAGVSRRRLEQLCREHLGTSPLHLLHRRRVQRAKDLLAGTQRSIAAIARQVGFSSGQRLTAAFTREVGMAPGAWRHKHRNRS